MKSKRNNLYHSAAAFKNPFDLIEDDEEPLSTTAYESKRYTPPTYNVHTPLPFNPY